MIDKLKALLQRLDDDPEHNYYLFRELAKNLGIPTVKGLKAHLIKKIDEFTDTDEEWIEENQAEEVDLIEEVLNELEYIEGTYA